MIKIKELLTAQDKSMYKLARDIGVYDKTLKRIVSNEGMVKERTAILICKYFGVDIKDVEEFQCLYGNGDNFKVNKKKRKPVQGLKKKLKEKSKVYKEVVKQDPCPNHNCPFCKKDLCTNDIVNKGIAGCMNKGVAKKESKNQMLDKHGRVNITINYKKTQRLIEEGVLIFE